MSELEHSTGSTAIQAHTSTRNRARARGELELHISVLCFTGLWIVPGRARTELVPYGSWEQKSRGMLYSEPQEFIDSECYGVQRSYGLKKHRMLNAQQPLYKTAHHASATFLHFAYTLTTNF